MRPWLLLVVAACSSGKDEPQAKPHVEVPRHSIDVTVHDSPISIRGVETEAQGGVLTIGYRVEGPAGAVVPAEIVCRVNGFNLVYPTHSTGKVPGPRLTAVFRPDPFLDAVPTWCEVRFSLVTPGTDEVIARACFHDGTLVDGACPEDTFPSPTDSVTLQPGQDVQLEHAAFEIREDAAVVTGIFTLVTGRMSVRYVAQLSCADSDGAITGEGGFTFVPLDHMSAGTSAYGPVPILLDRKPRPLAACDFRILSRAGTGPPAERVHARYCVTTAAVRVGPCGPN